MKKFVLCWLAIGLAFGAGKHPVSGRTIADVMSVARADWLVRAERQAEENPDLAVKLLELKAGMTVADLGAGVGYYALRMSPLVGPEGKVYATDVQPEMLRLLRKRLEAQDVRNVIPVPGSAEKTNLPDGEVDLILLVDVYHEFSEPQKMLASIAQALKPEGRLVLIEFRKEDPNVPIREDHKMSIETVKQELEAEGFRMVKVPGDLPWQHMFFFEKAPR